VVSYNATTFTGEDGRLQGVFAAARDITDQKRLEEQLRQAQNYNRGLIESSVDAMLTVDPTTRSPTSTSRWSGCRLRPRTARRQLVHRLLQPSRIAPPPASARRSTTGSSPTTS
jgi:PAS domain-containing protein